MLSTLYAHAEVPDRDAPLMLRLGQQLEDAVDDGTASLYRFAIANDLGAPYRLVIIFGHSKRRRAVELLLRLGYRQSAPEPERGLDAVFHPPGP
jgi:hypothetical protein